MVPLSMHAYIHSQAPVAHPAFQKGGYLLRAYSSEKSLKWARTNSKNLISYTPFKVTLTHLPMTLELTHDT